MNPQDLARAIQLFTQGGGNVGGQNDPLSALSAMAGGGRTPVNLMQFAPYMKGMMGQQQGVPPNPYGGGGVMDAGVAPMIGMA